MLLAVNTESFLTINYDEVSICCLTTNNLNVAFMILKCNKKSQTINKFFEYLGCFDFETSNRKYTTTCCKSQRRGRDENQTNGK